jgi:hypothetical protein
VDYGPSDALRRWYDDLASVLFFGYTGRMKQKLIFLTAGLVFSVSGFSKSPPLKVPHSHHANHGGMVLMLGDDHVEVTKSKGDLILDFSDKLRDSVKAEDFTIELRLASDQSQLSFKVDPNNPHRVALKLPESEIELKAFRSKNVPKGHVLKRDFVKIKMANITY